jgi:hypothetical protein
VASEVFQRDEASRSLRAKHETCERWSRLHPLEPPRRSHVENADSRATAPIVPPNALRSWRIRSSLRRSLPGTVTALTHRRASGPQRHARRLRMFFEVER